MFTAGNRLSKQRCFESESFENNELMGAERNLHEQRTVHGWLDGQAARAAVEKLHFIARFVQRGIDNHIIAAVYIRNIVGYQHFPAIEEARKRQRVFLAEGKPEIGAVAGDRPVIYPPEAQRGRRPHDSGDFGDLSIDRAVGIEQVGAGMSFIVIKELQLGQVVILDNASFHCKNRLREILDKVGCPMLPLPPYSPDLNKIEPLWSTLKSRIMHIAQHLAFQQKIEHALCSL